MLLLRGKSVVDNSVHLQTQEGVALNSQSGDLFFSSRFKFYAKITVKFCNDDTKMIHLKNYFM